MPINEPEVGNGQNVGIWTSYSKVICYENMGEEKNRDLTVRLLQEMSENSIMVSLLLQQEFVKHYVRQEAEKPNLC